MQFTIQPYEIKTTATKLSFSIVKTDDTTATVQYRLHKEDSSLAEEGYKVVPLAALSILSQSPVNISALNELITQWGIVATQQIIQDATI